MEVRDTRRNWLDEESSDDEAETTAPLSDVEKIASKVKVVKAVEEKAEEPVKRPSTPPKPREVVIKKDPSESPVASASSVIPTSKRKSINAETSNGRQRTLAPPVIVKDETTWTVDGIARHTDVDNTKTKLILMTNSATGERKVVEGREAFELDGWALAKYLLDRCEF